MCDQELRRQVPKGTGLFCFRSYYIDSMTQVPLDSMLEKLASPLNGRGVEVTRHGRTGDVAVAIFGKIQLTMFLGKHDCSLRKDQAISFSSMH